MSYHEGDPNEIAVDWCVTARVKGKGKPLVNTTMGSGVEACAAMQLWLGNLSIAGDRVTIAIECDLTSDEVPGGNENFRFACSGLPVPASLQYAQEWLAANGPLMGWGGGGF